VSLICLCYLEEVSAAQVRYAIRRIRRRAPNVPILVALFSAPVTVAPADDSDGPDLVERSLRGVVDRILTIASRPAVVAAEPQPVAAMAG
jgi:hypothetical protein